MTLRQEDWPRVKRIFDAALACSPSNWDAFLTDACGTDAALRRQVEVVLRAHQRAESFLESPASVVLDVSRLGDEGAAAAVGPYRIVRVLGHGGMGVVYAGVHQATGMCAAVKTVSALRADKLLQIRREIETLARLRHPGIVRILDYGIERGRPWYAMELLEHCTLAEWGLERRRDDKLGLMQRLCETLAYVHGEGVVHRDLKPRNILVTDRQLPILVDFGLVARVGVATGREVLDPTRVAGSIKYMAPEQIEGDLLDPRTDLYAVGCILYELVTGRAPFDGGVDEVIEQHRHRLPRPLSSLVENVPELLDRLVLQLLAKQPRDRIAYAADVGSALARLGAAALPAYAATPAARPYLCRPPLVGRDTVLDQIDSKLTAASRGAGAIVLIEGESGVGKTRLALEVARRASARGYHVVSGGASAVASEDTGGARPEGPPLHPLSPLFQAIADRCTEGGLEVAERLLGDRGPVLAAYAPALAEVSGQQDRPPLHPLPPAQARTRLFRCLTDSVQAYAASTPLAVLLDDLQWSDELTIDFLDHLARGPIATMPVIVIGTYRSEEPHQALASIAKFHAVCRIALPRIPEDAVSLMIGGMLSLADPPPGFVRFLTEKSEGNPYFVTEYLRMAVAERVVIRDAHGRWIFAETADPTEVVCESLPLPRSLRDLVDRRAQSLSPLARRVMLCATVVGREFDAVLVQVAEQLGDADISAAFDELARRYIVETTDSGESRFTHDKLREIPYSELPDGERRMLHGRVAAAMECRYADSVDLERMHASLGRHWSAAGDRGRAIPHLHKAGDRAVALHALREAIVLYREAVANIGALGSAFDYSEARRDEIAIREKLGDALTLAGSHEEARTELERVFAGLDDNKSIDRARLQRKIAKTLENGRDYAGAHAAYARAERILEATAGDRPLVWQREWVQVQLNRAWAWYWQGRPEEIAALIERVGPYVHQPGLARERLLYYQALGSRELRVARYVPSERTVEYAREALMASAEAGAAVDGVFCRFMVGFALCLRGRLDEAEGELATALTAARRFGDVSTEVRCLAYLALTKRLDGRVEETRQLADEALVLANAAGMTDYAAIAQAGLGWAALKQGQPDAARALFRAALDAWHRSHTAFPLQWIARLTLLAIDVDGEPLDELVALVQPLVDSAQMRLPDALDAALHDAVACHERHDTAAALGALHDACAAARDAGYL
jgi:tetratricopeptide (TPR) repeat protein